MTIAFVTIGAAALLGLASLAWYLFESRWDRRLFSGTTPPRARNLRAAQAAALIESEPRLAVIDIRSARGYERAHLPRALNLSAGDPGFAEKLKARDRTQPHLVYCDGGYRSRKACALMKELGFQDLYNLHRGILSWRLRRGPVEEGGARSLSD